MIELLENLGLLKEPSFELHGLKLDGVLFGVRGAAIPRNEIVEVSFSPLVHRSVWRADSGSEYYDRAECRLTMDQVIDSVIDLDGIVHFASKVSFKIISGIVQGFALYGTSLSYFGDIDTYAKFLQAFGKGNRTVEKEAYGDLMGYDHYYYGSRKLVSWDAMGNRVSLINLGAFEGNDGP